MPNVFFISDTHFGHEKTCTTFKNKDGTPLRPFSDAQEMDEEMVKRWNEVVRPEDKIYHLGDVTIKHNNLPILDRLNGQKRLIRGNHDTASTKNYMRYFGEIYGVRVLENFILSHIPLHVDSITKRFNTNVHGHTHANSIDHHGYFCVCVEQIDYRPIEMSELNQRIAAKKASYGV
jgi:calcineurin-like phosphoesterase family protein